VSRDVLLRNKIDVVCGGWLAHGRGLWERLLIPYGGRGVQGGGLFAV
jgi:hypothetical protein